MGTSRRIRKGLRWIMSEKIYQSIVSFCEACLEKYGDNYLGVGWTKKKKYADTRYRVMLEVIKQDTSGKVRLLDFGCGASHLYEYILEHGFKNIEYSGLDVSEKFINLSRKKFPAINYYHLDILADPDKLPDVDYIVLNGVFTVKSALSFEDMLQYFKTVIGNVFSKAYKGIAFNVMSKQVEWEREDLFHVPFDLLASFLTNNISRNFVFRHDYGLYEYTTYVYK
jgi:SAM-dependent methyltransferase